ncbi:hypothetical protein BBI01_10810 [Chryseobacterium artocarpi]|uniref:Photosynthesis system II assembly factor Ycf48/Hcf136-like domain-containing protein n=1 Tax=Chryseobacterium artocarpi TaxID=1414727 RepID=A0A1B8ZFW6_9FLAO|nr:T9SS type A sorting domain-containing protein [Chryseobacterium artocarpi]OCA70444.1 hypothetical protein BBI01_10810 [Chryseobacterium artocarpi]
MKFKLLTAALFAAIGNHALYSQNTWNIKYTFDDHFQNRYTSFIDENKGFVVAFTNDGKGAIKYTSDGGTTWTEIFKQNNVSFAPSITLLDENNIWAYQGQNIYKTTNNGTTWTVSTISNSLGYLKRLVYSSPTEGIMTTSTAKYKTTDGGQNWVVQKIFSPDDFELNSSGRSIDPTTGSGYGIAGIDLYQTNDYGNTWTKIFTLPDRPTAQSRRFSSINYKGYATGEYFYGASVGYDGATYIKSSNDTWQRLTGNFFNFVATAAFPGDLFMGYAERKVYNMKTQAVLYNLPGNNYINNIISVGNIGYAVGGNQFYKYSNLSLATKETQETRSFKIYTQNNSIIVSLPSAHGVISVYDMKGAIIKSGIIIKKGETKTIDMNPGVYIVTIRGEQKDYSQKVQIK